MWRASRLVKVRGAVPIRGGVWSDCRRHGSRYVGVSVSDAQKGEMDPYQLISGEMKDFMQSMKNMVNISGVPNLDKAAKHFLEQSGKLFRPLTLLLLASAAGGGAVLPSQRRLAEITEMIHTASLLHDDVIDKSDTRRGMETVNSMLGNQMAVLAGDFVLARASAALARLNDCDVVTVLSKVFDNLVRGEVLQLNMASASTHSWEEMFDIYTEKTFYKTASLIANSCRAVLMLGGQPVEKCDAGFEFGKHLGLSFQLVDDALDLISSEKELGKPIGADMRAGNATAPVLFAMKQFPELEQIIQRKFERDGDVQFATEKIQLADGVQQTLDLAAEHATLARAALSNFDASDPRAALEKLTYIVLQRRR